MKLLTSFFCILLTSCIAIAKQQESSGIPASINKIDMQRVRDQLVRVIKHNMELEPKIELELFQPPEMTLKDYLSITSVKTSQQGYSFKESDGVFVEDIKINENSVEITFEYYPKKSDAITLNCSIPILENNFGSTICKKV